MALPDGTRRSTKTEGNGGLGRPSDPLSAVALGLCKVWAPNLELSCFLLSGLGEKYEPLF